MSITYRFELGVAVGPTAVVSALVEAGAGAVAGDDGVTGTLRGGGWFDVDLAEYDPPDPVEGRFGFRPTVRAHFGLAKFGDLVAQETDVLRLALGVLDRLPGDALLHYEHDEAWLLRRGATLTVDAGRWRPHQLALLGPRPHERAPLAFG